MPPPLGGGGNASTSQTSAAASRERVMVETGLGHLFFWSVTWAKMCRSKAGSRHGDISETLHVTKSPFGWGPKLWPHLVPEARWMIEISALNFVLQRFWRKREILSEAYGGNKDQGVDDHGYYGRGKETPSG